jgi:hypothetical protein
VSCRKNGHRDREDFQREGEDQDLRDRPLEPACDREELPRADLFALVLGLEARVRRELHRDTREVPRSLGHREDALAPRRIVHRELAAGDAREHHEVIHVPVQHGGKAQFSQ